VSDTFSEVTSVSWFGRIWESIKSVLFGLLLFVVSFIVLFWNEGRAVHTAQSLAEGAAVVVSVPADSVSASNEGKLVHVTGDATTTETLADAQFGVSAPAIKLERTVEMYQWKENKKSETKKKFGGGTETVTTYNYEPAWSARLIDSSQFKQPSGHTNPRKMPVEAATFTAKKVTVGAFTLADSQIAMLDKKEAVTLDEAMQKSLPEAMKTKVNTASDVFYYFGADPADSKIGDARVSFQVVKPATVSLIARQIGNTFEPYQAKAGNSLNMLKYGALAADSMFKAAEQENAILTWILRGAGFFAMFLGLFLIFRPIAVFGDIVPLFGSMLAAGVGFACFLLALCLSMLTIAIGWIAYRPLIGIGLLAVSAGAVYLLIRHAQSGKPVTKAAAAGS
jgi:hypothetical protein